MEVRRATFEQVQKAQEDLIFSDDGIDKLIELNETIAPETRYVFFSRLATALLGKELDYPFVLHYNGNVYDLGSVAIMARRMAYFEDTPDRKQTLVLKGEKVKVPNKNLWIALRESIYKPMAEALTLSMKSSQELFRGGGDAYGVTPEEEIE